MDKFEKKIRKMVKNPRNAIVVGNGFGYLSSILSTHSTVFLFDAVDCNLKLKNLIYREEFSHLDFLTEIQVIYFDLSTVDRLEKLRQCWLKNHSRIIVEGNSIIDRKIAKPLYDTGWGCTWIDKKFQIWEKCK
jgi:hypothetical protein